jgi:hypothetical protein
MRGFAQFNQAYHAGRTGSAESYTNFMGQILNGETAQPNGRQAQDFGKMLADAVLSGSVQNGQQLIDWMQSSGLGGSNWQGVDDGWHRSPGLANQLVQMIRSSASGGGVAMGAGGGGVPGITADNAARMGLDNARFTRDNARLNGSEGDINAMTADRMANNETTYQNQVLQGQMQADQTISRMNQLFIDANRQAQDTSLSGNREFEDIMFESMPDNIDTETQYEIIQHYRERIDAAKKLNDEVELYRKTMTETRIFAEQGRAQIASGALSPDQVAMLQPQIDNAGETYMLNQDLLQNAESRMGMFETYQNDLLDKIMNNQVRAAEARALEFRAQSNALNAEFTREVTIRDMNRNGEGRDAIRAESDLKREEITLAFDQEIARLDEQLRFDPSLAESIEDTKEKLTALNEVRLENLTNETEKLVEQWDKVKRERTFEIDGQLLDSIQGSRSVYGIGNDEGMNQALMDHEILGQQNAFEAQVEGLRAMGAEAGIASIEIEAMVEKLSMANDIKIDTIKGQFNEWTEAINVTKQGTEGLFTDLLQGTKTVGESFRDFFSGILAGFAKIVAKRLTDGIFGGLLGTAGAGGGFGGMFQGLMSVLKFSEGGVVPMQGGQYDGLRQGNNAIGEALRQEGPRSVLAALTPGERVLTVAEAQQYERFRPVLNFANGGVVPGMASTGVRAGSVGMSISVGDVNVTAGGGGGGVAGGAMLNAIREGVPALVQREIARQQGLGGRL